MKKNTNTDEGARREGALSASCGATFLTIFESLLICKHDTFGDRHPYVANMGMRTLPIAQCGQCYGAALSRSANCRLAFPPIHSHALIEQLLRSGKRWAPSSSTDSNRQINSVFPFAFHASWLAATGVVYVDHLLL